MYMKAGLDVGGAGWLAMQATCACDDMIAK